MADLLLYIPNHSYSNDNAVYVSWLNGVYYVSDQTQNSFKLATTSGGSVLVQYNDTPIRNGYVRLDTDTATSSITGLDHLEGESVAVTHGGLRVGSTYTVSSGAITITEPATTYQVGKLYAMKARTMRLALPQKPDASQCRTKRVSEVVARVVRSHGNFQMGSYENGKESLNNVRTEFSTESSDCSVNTMGGFGTDGYVVIKSEEPLPLTLLSTVIEFDEVEK